jgi:NAD(P)-dependent dehydrogenase (short-subunit alcohol dehydrogenase family)
MKKTVLITGASRGIGLALTHLFLQSNYIVIGTTRKTDLSEKLQNNLHLLPLDLTDTESISNFKKRILEKELKVDILINNAAIGVDLDTTVVAEKLFRATFETNVIGTVLFTESLLEVLPAGAQIINISSKMGSIALCNGIDSVAYRMSKTALNMYSKILTNRLGNKIKVATVHPGWVRTELTTGNVNAPLSKEESAQSIFAFIESDYKNGIYWNAQEKKEIEW